VQARHPPKNQHAPGEKRHVRDPRSTAESRGSGNYLKPDVPSPQIPLAFVYLGCWFLMAGAVYYFLGIETSRKSIEQIDKELAVTA
jgi:hypothetical protein